MGQKPQITHWLIFLLLALTWGSSFILMKKALRDPDGNAVLAPLQVAGLRLSLAALVLLPFSLSGVRKVRVADYKWIAVVGLIGSGIPAMLFTTAQRYLDSNVAGILNALTPLFTLIVAVSIFRKPSEPRQVMGVIIGLAGAVCLMSLHGFGASQNGAFGLLIALATLSYGLSVNVVQHKLAHVSALHITSISLLMAGIPYGIYLATSDVATIVSTHPYGHTSLAAVVTLALAGTAMANMLYFWLTQHGGALFASSVTYVMPVVAVLWGVLDHENFGVLHVVFGAVILAGVWLIRGKK